MVCEGGCHRGSGVVVIADRKGPRLAPRVRLVRVRGARGNSFWWEALSARDAVPFLCTLYSGDRTIASQNAIFVAAAACTS